MKTLRLQVSIILLILLGTMQPIMAQADVVTKPQFPGGDKALVQFIDNNLKYPEEAQKQKWEGKTLVAFTVNEDGSLTNVRVLKSSQVVLDAEAMRIIKLMPKWSPATVNGTPKKEMVVLPVNFDMKVMKNIMY